MAPTPPMHGLEAFDEGTRLRAFRELVENPRFVLTGIGALLVERSERAFAEQRMGSIRWKSRGDTKMNPNWPAILRDFHEGRTTPPGRRLKPQPVLVDRQMLRRSFSYRVITGDTVEAGTVLPYAGVLHAGGESKTVPVTAVIQQKLWKWIQSVTGRAMRSAKKAGKDKTPQARAKASDDLKAAEGVASLKWLLNKSLVGQRLTVKHPARPMVGLPPDLVADIEGLYGQKVGEA